MKNIRSIAMLSLLVFAPAALANGQTKTEKAKAFFKTAGRVVVGATLGVAINALEEKVSNSSYAEKPENLFNPGYKHFATMLLRRSIVTAATQAGREWLANRLDSRFSKEGQHTILDGSRAASLIRAYDYHFARTERATDNAGEQMPLGIYQSGKAEWNGVAWKAEIAKAKAAKAAAANGGKGNSANNG